MAATMRRLFPELGDGSHSFSHPGRTRFRSSISASCLASHATDGGSRSRSQEHASARSRPPADRSASWKQRSVHFARPIGDERRTLTPVPRTVHPMLRSDQDGRDLRASRAHDRSLCSRLSLDEGRIHSHALTGGEESQRYGKHNQGLKLPVRAARPLPGVLPAAAPHGGAQGARHTARSLTPR